jgi:hypothetical protein
VVVGWEAHVIWLERMVPLLSRGCAHWVNQSVSAFLSRLAGADVFSWEIAPSSAWVRTGSVAISLLAILALLRLTRPGGESSLALEFSLVLVTTLFVSPISWIHHAVLSLPAIFFLIRHLVAADRLTPASSILLATSFTLIGIYLKPPGLFARLPLTPLASYHLLGQVLLWGLLAAEILRVRRASVLTGAAA